MASGALVVVGQLGHGVSLSKSCNRCRGDRPPSLLHDTQCTGAIEAAKEVVARTPGAYSLGQFDNPANPAIHFRTTGPEIWRDSGGQVDTLVLGVGTGGTLTGAGSFLKAQKAGVQVVSGPCSE